MNSHLQPEPNEIRVRGGAPALAFQKVRESQVWRLHFTPGYCMTFTDNGYTSETPLIVPGRVRRILTRAILGWRWERVS